MLIKKSSTTGAAAKTGGKLSGLLAGAALQTMDRRGFLKASGLAAGGLAAVSALTPAMVKPAKAAPSVLQPAWYFVTASSSKTRPNVARRFLFKLAPAR